MGVNGCMPGPRSGTASSGNVPGPFIASRPLGQGGQVLGVSTEVTPSPSPSPSASPNPSVAGQVQGASTEICTNWRLYIPWILLIVQFLFIFFFDYRMRDDSRPTKHILAVLATAVSIIIFYLLRECNCYGDWSWLAWLCRWYWVVAIILTLLIKGFSYAFLDETGEREVHPKHVPPAAKTEEKVTKEADEEKSES